MKTIFPLGIGTAIAAVLLMTNAAFAAPPNLPLDNPTMVKGVEVVCTGIADNARRDARWANYPLKIVFAGKGGQFMSDVTVTIRQDEKDVVTVFCGGAWLLAKLPAANYRISGSVEGQTVNQSVTVPAKGQKRIVLTFRESGGAISEEHGPAH